MLKKTFIGVLLAVFLSTFLIAGIDINVTEAVNYSSSGTTVGGYISENTTWTLDDSPYIVVEDVVVEPDIILTIEPGVVVKFVEADEPGVNTKNLVIDGALIAQGNATHPIVFTSNSTTPRPGDWGSIRFRDSSNDSLCRLSYCIIQYGSTGVFAYTASPQISYSNISNNYNYGVLIAGGVNTLTTISYNVISNNGYLPGYSDYSGGLMCSVSSGSFVSIFNNRLLNNSGFGLYVYTGTLGGELIRVEGNEIIGNKGYGVYSYFSSAVLVRNTISNNWKGVNVISYDSENVPTINYNKLLENGDYDLIAGGYDINATYNWWGTTNETAIKERIYDYYDDYGRGRVFYKPYLVPPIANFTFSPETPYAYRTVTFNASLSFNPHGSIINYTWDFGDGDIITTTSPTITHVYVDPGTYNVTLTVTDEFELTNSTMTILTVLEDDVPPVTIDDYDGEWRNADFTITLTATDYESGVAETYYRINDGPVKAVSVDGQPLITTEGANNTLEYWSVDNAGNEGLPHNILTGIKLDKTAPTIGIPSRVPEGDVEPYQEVRILVNVTDFTSDVKNVALSCLNIDKPVSNFSTVKDLNITLCLHRTTYYYKDPVSGDVTITYPNGTAFRGEFILYILHLTDEGMSTTAWIAIDGFTKFYLSPPVFRFGPGNYTIGMSSLSTADGYIIESRWQVFPSVQVEAKDDSIIWIDLPMTFNSTTGLYEATIPGQGEDILVRYKITAYDNAGNHRVEDKDGEYHVYTVIPEFTSTIILLLFIIATLVAIVYRRKHSQTT